MKLRMIIIDFSVVVVVSFLFIFWHQTTIVKATPLRTRVRAYEVSLVTTDKEYQYWDFVNAGAEEMANSVGINYSWVAPNERNVQEQIEVINQAVEAGVDALLIAADDPRRISSVVEDAKAKGVKVIYVDSPAFEEAITTLATDNYEAGVRAGEALLAILNEKGIGSGSIGIIGFKDKENTDLRERGFRDILAWDGRFTVLRTIETARGEPSEAKAAAERFIQRNDDLIALFGTNEGTSVGVGNAILESGNRYIGIGFDQTDVMMELLREGSLQAIVVQNPYTMGYLGMAEALAALLGKETGPDFINTGVSVIRSDIGGQNGS
jgi:ribose transport system substrate-binding protein